MNTPDFILDQARSDVGLWCSLVSIPPLGVSSEERENALTKIVNDFGSFLLVDKHLTAHTVYERKLYLSKFLNSVGKAEDLGSREFVRKFLTPFSDKIYTYNNYLKPIKLFYQFIGHPEVLASFKFPKPAFKLKDVLTKGERQRFYSFMPTLRYRALFLFYASTGLRLMEVLELARDDIEFSTGMVRPHPHSGESKRSYLSFFNLECSKVLKQYLGERTDQDTRLFPTDASTVHDVFKEVSKESGIKITPKKLRDWFCSEMGELGVPDRFVDAFCGRVPFSVLARHYTDYSPNRLKQIYDKAKLTLLA